MFSAKTRSFVSAKHLLHAQSRQMQVSIWRDICSH